MRHDDDTTRHAEPVFECVGCGRATTHPEDFAWPSIGVHSSFGECHDFHVPVCSRCDGEPDVLEWARREFADVLD